MKKLLSIILCFAFTAQFAFAGNTELLKQVLDEYNYSLSVEWDQKDQNFYDQKTKEFFNSLNVLVIEKGLNKEDILSLLEKSVKDKYVLEAMKTRFSLNQDSEINTQQILEVFQETNRGLYQRGASWIDGDTLLWIGGGLVVAALIGYSIWFAVNYECVRSDYVKHCGYTSSTSSGPRYYDCWYKYECVEYQKRN